MSAYIESAPHIHALVTAGLHRAPWRGSLSWYINGERKELTRGNASEVGQMLVDENIRSVAYRYGGEAVDTLPGPVDKSALLSYRYAQLDLSPVAVLKACSGYEYQSCETDDWEQTEAHAFIEALKDATIGRLDGYEEAAWSIG